MRVESDGYFVSFFVEQEKKKYFNKEFFLNKKSLCIENGKEKYVYMYELPNFLIKGTPYFGKIASSDFFSENQRDLLKFLGLKQTELGLFPIEIQGIKRKFGASFSKTVIEGEALPQIGDLVGGVSLSEYVFEFSYVSKNWVGNFSQTRKVLIPSESSIKKATNSPSGVLVDGLPTGIENLTGQKTVSEGIVIIDKQESIYLPNNIDDLKGIIDKAGQGFVELASVPPITGAGSSTALNPAFALKLSEIGNNILALRELLK